jgi:hypothetical protein
MVKIPCAGGLHGGDLAGQKGPLVRFRVVEAAVSQAGGLRLPITVFLEEEENPVE